MGGKCIDSLCAHVLTDYLNADVALSGLRPGNPTPGHATGLGSPSVLRPTNPTPAHALKQSSDRPGKEQCCIVASLIHYG